ncbi:hypothetical protein DFJ69_1474 [Thermomonospora umbrina]|uniref:Uncharacterized protein n=1 Tax=Thermomonospora umbrina TaxID=111806 RepID=A0A3D9SJF2_9ACTN|nr:hypothetical protein DFJ69_1474 [Thermomonospora umbrina]
MTLARPGRRRTAPARPTQGRAGLGGVAGWWVGVAWGVGGRGGAGGWAGSAQPAGGGTGFAGRVGRTGFGAWVVAACSGAGRVSGGVGRGRVREGHAGRGCDGGTVLGGGNARDLCWCGRAWFVRANAGGRGGGPAGALLGVVGPCLSFPGARNRGPHQCVGRRGAQGAGQSLAPGLRGALRPVRFGLFGLGGLRRAVVQGCVLGACGHRRGAGVPTGGRRSGRAEGSGDLGNVDGRRGGRAWDVGLRRLRASGLGRSGLLLGVRLGRRRWMRVARLILVGGSGR